MDKGFCSKNNIDAMFEDNEGIRFLTEVHHLNSKSIYE
jgi:hypothetical protein